jgi:signal transduction histidine kinase
MKKKFGFLNIFNSYQNVLIFTITAQIIISVGIIEIFTFRNSQKVVDDVTVRLQTEISNRIQERLLDLVDIPPIVNFQNIKASSFFTSPETADSQNLYYINQLKAYPLITSTYIGLEDGSFIGANRATEGHLQLLLSDETTQNNLRYYQIDDVSGAKVKQLKEFSKFDPRSRSWYQEAIQTKFANWSNIFVDFVLQSLVITATLPLLDKEDQALGVSGTSFYLFRINQFLENLKIGKSGETYIIERNGLLVGTSTSDSLFKKINEKIVRTEATESDNDLIRKTSRFIQKRFIEFSAINKSQRLELEIGDDKHYMQVTPFKTKNGLDWLIVVTIPESDFMAQVNSNRLMMFIFICFALIISTLISIVVAKWVTRPILHLNKTAASIVNGRFEKTGFADRNDEIGQLAKSFDTMAEALKNSFEELELRVEKRTEELNDSISYLKQTQDHLIKTERLTALGNLVSGISHEVNTPLGISITENSFLIEKIEELKNLYQTGKLTESQFANFIKLSTESTDSIMRNLTRSAELMTSFKQIAIDQSSESTRLFDVKEYLEGILRSLHPMLRKTSHTVQLSCPGNIKINNYPGFLSQIITNLITNSLKYGFVEKTAGLLKIEVSLNDSILNINYSDDGIGMDAEVLKQIFDPFFTTQRNFGGSGLGLYIVYNLINYKLKGTIDCQSEPGKGVQYKIEFPTQ